MGVNYKLYSFGMDNKWHLVFVGYSEAFTKSYLKNVRWSRRIENTWFGIDGTGFYYKIEEDQLG